MGLLLLIALLGITGADNGTLRIQSEPGAEVLWEGVSLEATDLKGLLTVSDIPPGKFELVLRKPGFREYRTSVTILAGETSVLSVRLHPVTGRPAPGAEKKPPPDRAPTASPKRAEPAPSDQGNKLSQLLESAPKRGPVPVWPASSPAVPVEKRSEIPVWPFILGITVLAVVLWFARRIKRVALAPSPALLDDSEVPEPARTAERTAAFLNDLKKREELLEQGVEIIPARTVKPVIDLDSASVREVEDQ
ncbi:MAG: PEGA domain-containing protein [Acidobacteria bacterium]|nr:MAG: PEGA domain-containing protein [Acidobacteriota bacterium]